MKYNIITALLLCVAISLSAQKNNDILVAKQPYDSLTNFVKEDPAQYTGQELWLKSVPSRLQDQGYANFHINFKKFDNSGNEKNVYLCCDGYNSKYSEMVDKHFYVEMVFTYERKDRATKEKVVDTFFKLKDLSNGEYLYYYLDPTMSHYSFPFVTMGYLEKQKELLKKDQYVFANEIIVNASDLNTGKAIKSNLGGYWSYVDITVDSNTHELSLIVKDKKGQTFAVPMSEVKNQILPKKVYTAKEAKSMRNRFGEFNYARILQQKIASNMNKEALKLSWGEPIEVMESGSGKKKTEKWIYTTSTITFRGNSIIKME